MTEDIKKIENAVSALNTEVMEQTQDEGGLSPFEFSGNGETQSVTFFGHPIWDSENDERESGLEGDGEEEALQDIDAHLAERAQDLLAVISKLKL